jgi:putative acetyltransferase
MPPLALRPETPADCAAIHRVNELAFERADEAEVVDRLRESNAITLSLVALEDLQVVGHVLFSPVTVKSEKGDWGAIGLGPVAVLPTHQRRGIGAQLIRAGLEQLREAGHGVVIVLGHPAYYPRFGFRPTQAYNIRWEQTVPDEVFMLLELQPGAVAGRAGVVYYHPAFNGV